MGCIAFDTEFGKETTIYGENASGKSTVYDAFLWCVFGKNAKDEKSFYIKNTKDLSLNRQDHVVEVWLECNNAEISLKKVYKEEHKHIKGAEGTQFTGHMTDHYYNDVPMKAMDYKAKIEALISEETFKVITNVHFFNDLEWNKKRAILEQIADIPTDDEIAKGNPDFETLMTALSGKSFIEYQTQLNKQRKLIYDELQVIPIKISEASISKKEAIMLQDEKMLESIKAKIALVQAQKDDITKTNKAALEDINKKQQELSELKRKLNEATQNRKAASGQEALTIEGEINVLVQKIINLKDQIKSQKEQIERLNRNILEKETRNTELRDKFEKINEEAPPEVDPADKSCPVCKNPLNENQIQNHEDVLIGEWKLNKIKKIEAINQEGKENKAYIEEKKADIVVIEKDIIIREAEADSLQKELDLKNIQKVKLVSSTDDTPTQLEIDLNDQIAAFIVPEPPKVDFTIQDEEIKKLQDQNDACVTNIAIIKANKAIDDRIKELKEQEIVLSQKLTSFDKTLFVMSEFTKAKVTKIEQAVNKLFKYCQVQMFEKQVNGDMNPTCLITYDDVPYQNVNTAGKINMGIDIINTLSNFNKVQAPVFIDNTESINKIIDTDLQIIKLEVSKESKLTVTINQN
jgi:exonuclease SbcC